jgi:Protein tyrosine and serine/threonine kinase
LTQPFKKGDEIGGFVLLEPLDEGGNAFVWQARRPDLGEVALKILKSKNVQSEPYARFRQEVDVLKRIGDRRGVLPLLDADVPIHPSKKRPAWLAMPLAQPLTKGADEESVEEIVQAAASIATTLADLLDDFGLAHRDLKPSNLYRHSGEAAVGDFGLVTFPDAAQLTDPGKPLGPTNFIPHEMLTNPSTAEPAPADVFSFGKTLWVLISGVRWPPGGEQSAANAALTLRQYRSHRRLTLIDQLIERCTKHLPQDRATMRHVADDLRAWLAMADGEASVPDLSDYGRRLREVAAPTLDESARRQRLEEIASEMADRLASLLKPMERALLEEYPLTETDVWDEATEEMLRYREHFGSALVVAQDARATRLVAGGDFGLALTIGRYVGTTDDGFLHVSGSFDLGHERVLGPRDRWEYETVSAPADSLQALDAVERLARDLAANVGTWVDRFVAVLAGDRQLGEEPPSPPPKKPLDDQALRSANREERAREIDEQIHDFLSRVRGIDQPFSASDLVASVADPKFDLRAAHGALKQLVEMGRVERRRGAAGDEYWSN